MHHSKHFTFALIFMVLLNIPPFIFFEEIRCVANTYVIFYFYLSHLELHFITENVHITVAKAFKRGIDGTQSQQKSIEL